MTQQLYQKLKFRFFIQQLKLFEIIWFTYILKLNVSVVFDEYFIQIQTYCIEPCMKLFKFYEIIHIIFIIFFYKNVTVICYSINNLVM